MREQLRPIGRFLRWYCQPPDFVRAAAVVPPALRLPLGRAVAGLAALYALGLALHLPSALLGIIAASVGCSVTLAYGWRATLYGPDMRGQGDLVQQDNEPASHQRADEKDVAPADPPVPLPIAIDA